MSRGEKYQEEFLALAQGKLAEATELNENGFTDEARARVEEAEYYIEAYNKGPILKNE